MTDVIIVGAGVMGLLSARELLREGLRVRLLERQAAGRESSWAGGGILSPLCPWRTDAAIIRLFLLSRPVYPELTAQLQRATGIDPEWRQSGLAVLDSADQALAMQWCQTHGLAGELLPPAQFQALEPHVRAPSEGAIHLPEIAQVRNPRLLAALRADVLHRGGEILEQTEVTEVILQGDAVTAVRAGERRFAADAYVLATGAWTGDFTRRLLPSLAGLEVAPVKGQMILFAARPGLLQRIVLDGGRYLIPRRDGRILAGSTVEESGFDKSTTAAAREELRAMAVTLLPALAEFPIEVQWAGLRPGSPEGVPSIGRHPHIRNLYVNAGHFRNGFVMAPASVGLLVDSVLERPPRLDPTPYLPRLG